MPDRKIEHASLLFLWAETPVHAGAGSEQAEIDLTIQRSIHTRWAVINDSTLRGGFRRLAPNDDKANEWFGTEQGDAPHPGRISTPDGEILLFPVASAKGTLAWVTCVAAWEYFRRRASLVAHELGQSAQDALKALPDLGNGPGPEEAWIQPGASAVIWQGENSEWIILEADRYDVAREPAAQLLACWITKYLLPFDTYWPGRFEQRFAILEESAFTHYVETKTDIRTRIRMSEGAADDKGLWSEENLPVDSAMYTILMGTGERVIQNDGAAQRTRDSSALHQFRAHLGIGTRVPVVQLGGDQNLGRGFLRMRELGHAFSAAPRQRS